MNRPCLTTCQERRPLGLRSRHSLDGIVQSFLDDHAEDEKRYLRYYAIQRTLPAAIEKAVLAVMPDGSRHSHQHRIPRAVLTQGRDALMGREYKRIKTFAELHRMVAQAVGSIRGIGPLTVYDTAHRLGAYLRLSPEVVYLHAGTRLGAQALGLNWRAESLPMTDFPRAFQRLTPEQVEDCLCIYKAELSAWAQSRHRNA